MARKTAAALGGLLVAGVGSVAGAPFANASEHGGGECNNYGNGSVVVAPFCGAPTAPTPPTDTLGPVLQPLPPNLGDLRPVVDDLTPILQPLPGLDDLRPANG